MSRNGFKRKRNTEVRQNEQDENREREEVEESVESRENKNSKHYNIEGNDTIG